MKRHLPEEYKRRPIVKTVHSVIKRKSGSFVRSWIPELAEKEIVLKIIAYNVRRTTILNNSKFIFVTIRFSTEPNIYKKFIYKKENRNCVFHKFVRHCDTNCYFCN